MLGPVFISLLGASALIALLTEAFNGDDAGSTPSPPGPADPSGDTLTGTNLNDELIGGLGNDILYGLEGNDNLIGGGGNDALFGDSGNDLMGGRDGDDVLDGGDDSDTIRGNDGNDILLGGSSADELYGHKGNDLLVGLDISAEELLAGTIIEKDTDDGDYMGGAKGADTFLIGSNDTVSGGGWSDNFILGSWIAEGNSATITDFVSDPASGEEDVISFAYSGDIEPTITVETIDNGDEIPSDASVLVNGVEVALVVGAGTTLTMDDIVMINLDEQTLLTMRGTEGADEIAGTELGDRISSGAGDDTIDGGLGTDTIYGMAGDDVITGYVSDPTVPISIKSDIDAGDYIGAGEGNDTIHMGAGDTVVGSKGEDTFIVYDFGEDMNAPTINDFDPAVDTIQLDLEIPLSSHPVILEGLDGEAEVWVGDQMMVIVAGAAKTLTLEHLEYEAQVIQN